MKDMLAEGWILQNECGNELDFEQVMKICAFIKEHSEKSASPGFNREHAVSLAALETASADQTQ